MFLSIEDAKTKLCPVADKFLEDSKCLADGCAMWRWGSKEDASEVEEKPIYPIRAGISLDVQAREAEKIGMPAPVTNGTLVDQISHYKREVMVWARSTWKPPMPGSGFSLLAVIFDETVNLPVALFVRPRDKSRRMGYCGLAGRPEVTK